MSPSDIISNTRSASTWPEVFLCLVAARAHKEDKILQAGLVGLLGDGSTTRLRLAWCLVIWDRIATGEIQFRGHGIQVSDDIFQIAGRANWILRNMTGKSYGAVHRDSSRVDLTAIKQRWTEWLGGKNPPEVPTSTAPGAPFKADGPVAVEAMVAAMQPTSERGPQNYVLALDPSDKPDDLDYRTRYAKTLLSKWVEVPGDHDYAWWSRWWHENGSRLAWDKKRHLFIVAESK